MTKRNRVPTTEPKSKARSKSAKSKSKSPPPSGKRTKRSVAAPTRTDPREVAIRLMKAGVSQKTAAKMVGIGVKRLRRYLHENTHATRKGLRWIIADRRPSPMLIASRGKVRTVQVANSAKKKVSRYWIAVNKFIDSNNPAFLKGFVGEGIRDANGQFHKWETGPNTLRKLDSIGELSFTDIYANTAN